MVVLQHGRYETVCKAEFPWCRQQVEGSSVISRPCTSTTNLLILSHPVAPIFPRKSELQRIIPFHFQR
jgi:hypothetical protein